MSKETGINPYFRREISKNAELQRKISEGESLDDEEIKLSGLSEEGQQVYKEFRDELETEENKNWDKEVKQYITNHSDTLPEGVEFDKTEADIEFIWQMVEKEVEIVKEQFMSQGYSEDEFCKFLVYWSTHFDKPDKKDIDFMNKGKANEKGAVIDKLKSEGIQGEIEVTKWVIKNYFGHKNMQKSVKNIHRMLNQVSDQLQIKRTRAALA